MRTVVIAATLVATTGPVPADPIGERSQHPRVGTLAEIQFSSASNRLRWGANRKLGRVVAWAVANPRGFLVLEGHADRRGPAEYNLELSLERAHAVRRALVEAGVRPEQLVIAGFGETGIQRGTNRRVAIWATRNDRDTTMAYVRARGPTVIARGDDTAMARR